MRTSFLAYRAALDTLLRVAAARIPCSGHTKSAIESQDKLDNTREVAIELLRRIVEGVCWPAKLDARCAFSDRVMLIRRRFRSTLHYFDFKCSLNNFSAVVMTK